MLDPALVMLCLVILAALLFDYINGFHDTANAIATCISTRAMSVKTAILMAAVLNFAGAMISTKVASTIGKGIVDKDNVTQMVVLAGVTGAIVWDLVTWYYGLPSSSSHAIIGGLMGAVFAHAGMGALKWAGLKKIILALLISPILGTIVGFIFMLILYRGVPQQRANWTQQELPPYADRIGGLDGLLTRYRRCPEVHGGYHHGALKLRRHLYL